MSGEPRKKRRAYRMTDLQMVMFIRLYSERPSLWDKDAPAYRDRAHRSRTLSEICAVMDLPGFGSNEAAVKIKNLRTTFKQEERKVKESRKLGGEYLPRLHWYHFVDNFLNKKHKPGRGKANGGSSQKEIELVDLDGLFETSGEIKTEGCVWINDDEQQQQQLETPAMSSAMSSTMSSAMSSTMSSTMSSAMSSTMSSAVGGGRWKGISDDVDEDYDGSPPPSMTSRTPSPILLDDPLTIEEDPLAIKEDPLTTIRDRTPPLLKPMNSSLVQLDASAIKRTSPGINDGLALKEPDEFDYFSKSLAVQLRSMPLENALGCMERLQAVVREERLRLLAANKPH